MSSSTPPPAVEAHLWNAESYDQVQRWTYQELGKPEWSATSVEDITVSMSRGRDGRWQGHLYGWPPAPVVFSPGGADTDLWARRGQPYDLGHVASGLLQPPPGLTVDRPLSEAPPRPIPVVPGMFESAQRGAVAAERQREHDRVVGQRTYVGEGTARVHGVPVPPEMQGSFFVPNPAYDGGAPLHLDLDTEVPKESRKARRARLRAEQAAEADPAPVIVHGGDPAGGVVVPPSGHRPDGSGIAPVSYPLCTSTIEAAGKRWRCARRHRPDAHGVRHTNAGYLWNDSDERIVRVAYDN